MTTALIATVLLGVGLVGYLFRPIGIPRRSLFIIAAAGLFVPLVPSGPFALLTWTSNGVCLVLAVMLVGGEWLARSAHAKSHGVSVRSEVR